MVQMLWGRFGLQNKDLGPSLGAIDIIFRAGSVPTSPGGWGVRQGCAPLETQGEGPSPLAAGHARKEVGGIGGRLTVLSCHGNFRYCTAPVYLLYLSVPGTPMLCPAKHGSLASSSTAVFSSQARQPCLALPGSGSFCPVKH